MKFTVVWNRLDERELASIWMSSPRRKEVTRAADRIDRLLRRGPENQGAAWIHETRMLLAPPLGVTFAVYVDDRRAEVLDVWEFPGP